MIDAKKYNERIDVNERTIFDGIKYILSHFEKQHELFPRTIMTSNTKGQVKVEYESSVQNSINKIFNMFKDANYYDCKINGFPYNTQHTKIDPDVKNKATASFIMIDLDLQDFSHDIPFILCIQTSSKIFLYILEIHSLCSYANRYS